MGLKVKTWLEKEQLLFLNPALFRPEIFLWPWPGPDRGIQIGSETYGSTRPKSGSMVMSYDSIHARLGHVFYHQSGP